MDIHVKTLFLRKLTSKQGRYNFDCTRGSHDFEFNSKLDGSLNKRFKKWTQKRFQKCAQKWIQKRIRKWTRKVNSKSGQRIERKSEFESGFGSGHRRELEIVLR